MSAANKDTSSSDDARELRHGIERTRAEMTATVAAIEHRLDPAELRSKALVEFEHVEIKVKEALRAGIEEARTVVKEDLTLAKAAVKDEILLAKASVKEEFTVAKAAVKQELLEAKASVKSDINEAIENAKTSVRKATLGRVEDLATQAGDAMNDSRETLIETMKLNPIPTAIVGVGLAWLLMNRSSASRRRQIGGIGNGYPNQGGWVGARAQYDNGVGRATNLASDAVHRVGSMAGQVVESAQHLAGGVAQGVSHATAHVGEGLGGAATAVNHAMHDARDFAASAAHQGYEAASTGLHQTTDAAGRLVHQVGDGMTHLGQSAQHLADSAYAGARKGVVRAEHGFESVLETNPLAVGAAVALVGAAIGFALPRTSREDALMGSTRDGVVEKAANYAQEATHSLEHLAANVGTSAKQALQGA